MKVILHKLFPYAPYLNEYIGLEDEQRIGETELEGIERLRKLVEQSHRERYPNLYQKGNEALIESFAIPPTNTYVINKEKERIEIAIDNAKTVEELNHYMSDSMKYGLVEHFINKKKLFQNGNT